MATQDLTPPWFPSVRPPDGVSLFVMQGFESMEALLLAAQVPGDEAMRELAVARAVAVKDFLLGLKLGEDRVFLGAPRTGSDGGDAARPRAELQLAPR